jgi:hypothetical protein
MVMRRTVSATLGSLGLVLSTALMSIAVTPPRQTAPRPADETQWVTHVAAVDAALQANDLPAARKAWQAAYGAALASRRWEAYTEVAGAHLRIAELAGTSGAPSARSLYLSALFRARDAGSRDGLLRAADAFDQLGDREVAARARTIAGRLPPRN